MLACCQCLTLQRSVFWQPESISQGDGTWLLGRADRIQQRQHRKRRLAAAAAGREEPDVAVFRFTLGIPGFDDALIPRAVGVLGLLLLLVNHILDHSAYSVGQVRAEALGAFLAALCILTPTVEARLREAAPGRGRKAASGDLEGAVQLFKLDPCLPEAAKQELAWASYALLRNTNTSGLIVLNHQRVLVARGAIGTSASPSGSQPTLDELGQTIQRWRDALEGEVSGAQPSAYLPDKAALGRVDAKAWEFLPSSASSVLVQRLEDAFAEGKQGQNGTSKGNRGLLVMWSDQPRALSPQERRWAAAIASKFDNVLKR